MARPLHVPLMAGCYASQPREYTFKNWFVLPGSNPCLFAGRELDRLECDVLDQPLEIFGNIDTPSSTRSGDSIPRKVFRVVCGYPALSRG